MNYIKSFLTEATYTCSNLDNKIISKLISELKKLQKGKGRLVILGVG